MKKSTTVAIKKNIKTPVGWINDYQSLSPLFLFQFHQKNKNQSDVPEVIMIMKGKHLLML